MESVAKNRTIYEFDEFRLVPGEELLLRNGEQILLNIKSFGVLKMLVERHGHLVTKSEIIDTVWKDTFVEEGSLTKAIWLIRQALGDTSKEKFIQTVPKRGYRFVFPVSVIADRSGAFRLTELSVPDVPGEFFVPQNGSGTSNGGGKAQSTAELVAPQGAFAFKKVPAFPSSSWLRSPTVWAVGILLVGILVAGVYLNRIARVSSPKVDSVAVVPFTNLTGQENDAYIVDGMTEHLINSLSRIPRLHVAAPSSSFAARDRSIAPQEASRELKVGHLLSGNVQRDGEFLRVSIRLIEGSTGRVVWTDGAFRPAEEIFALQDDVARLSAEAITGNPAAAEVLGNHGTADREAYLHYLKGLYLWHKQTESDTIKAISEFERSVARDPNFALAYCGLADSYTILALTFRPPNETMPKAAEYAAKALTIDPNLPEALFSDASVDLWYRRDISAAERSVRRAIKLRPNYPLAYDLYGNILLTQGRINEGLTEIKRAVELDPLAHFQACDLAWQYYHGGRYADAAALARANLEKVESCPFERLFLGQSLSEMGRNEEAIEELAKIEGYSADWPPAIAERARIYAVMGESEKGKKLLVDLESRASDQYVDPYSVAVVHSGFRDADKTIHWLNRAVEANSYNLIYLDRDPRFNEIKADHRFGELLRRAGLPISAPNP